MTTRPPILQINIEKIGGVVSIDRRRKMRDARRKGATSRAAARLAAYRVRKYASTHGYTMVDDIWLHVDDDIMRDERKVAATVRVIRAPFEVGPFKVPPELTRVALVDPREHA